MYRYAGIPQRYNGYHIQDGYRVVFFYSRDSKKYKYTTKQGWVSSKKQRDDGRTRVFHASSELGEIAGMMEDFHGALSYDDIIDKYTVPQLAIMRLDKPAVEVEDEDTQTINSAEEMFSVINQRK